MKQRMVFEVSMDSQEASSPWKVFGSDGKKMSDKKMKAKIFKIVVGVEGLDKAEFKGADKHQMEVEGEDFDPIELIQKLRRNAYHATIVSLAPVKAEAAKEPEAEKNPAVTVHPMMHWAPYPYMTVY